MWLFLNIKSYLFLLLAFLAGKSEQTGSNPSCNVTGSPHIESISIQLDPLGGDQVSLIINWNSSSTDSSGSLLGTDSNVIGYINTTNSTFERTGNLSDTYILQITENGALLDNCSILLENPYNLSCSVVNSSKFNLDLPPTSFDLNNHRFTDLIGRSPPDGSSNATQTDVIAFDGLSAGYQFVVNLNVTDNSTGVQYVIYHTDNQCSTTPADCNVTSNEDLDSVIVTRESKSSEVHNIRMQMVSVVSQCCQYANETVNSSYSLEARSTNEFYTDADIFFQCEARNGILGLNNNATCASNETSLVIEPKPESGMTTIFANISKDGENTGLQSQTGASSFQFLDLEPETSYEVALHMTSNTTGINHILLVQCNTTAVIAPANLNFTEITKTSFTVTWDYSAGDADTFVLTCITNGCGLNYNVSANSTSYSFENLKPNTTYEFELKAVIGSYVSNSITNNVTTDSVPVPENFRVSTKTESSVTLVWNNLDNEITTFEISCLQSSVSNCPLSITRNVSQTNEQINHLTPGAQYTFQIRAIFLTFYSVYSENVTFRTYDVPADLTVTPNELGNSYYINWTYSNNGGGDLTRFELSCQPDCGTESIDESNRTYTWNDLSRGTTYTFSLSAVYGNYNTTAITETGTASPLSVPYNVRLWSDGNNSKNSSSVSLKWDSSVKNSDGVQFRVSCTGDTSCASVNVTGIQYTYNGLTPGQLYEFRVQTLFQNDFSELSEAFSVRTKLSDPDLSQIFYNTSNILTLPAFYSCADGQPTQILSNIEAEWGLLGETDCTYDHLKEFTFSQSPCEEQTFYLDPISDQATAGNQISFGHQICLKLKLVSNNGGFEESSEAFNNISLYPDIVVHISCQSSTTSSLTFSWNKGSGVLDSYIASLDNGPEVSNQLRTTKTYSNLIHGTKYTINVKSISNNLSSESVTKMCRTKIEVPDFSVEVTADFKVRITTNIERFSDDMQMTLYLIDRQDSCEDYTELIEAKSFSAPLTDKTYIFEAAVEPGRVYCTKVLLNTSDPDEQNSNFKEINTPLSLQINSVGSTSIAANIGDPPNFNFLALVYSVAYFEVQDNSEQLIVNSSANFGVLNLTDLKPGARSQITVTLTTITELQVSVESEIFHTIPALPTVENAESQSDRCSFTLRADQIVTSFKVDFNDLPAIQESPDHGRTGSATFTFTDLQPHHNYSFLLSSISSYGGLSSKESSVITHR